MTDTASPTAKPDEKSPSTFVRELHRLNRRARGGDGTARAALARLRRSLGTRDLDLSALREVGAWLPDYLTDDTLDAYLLTAALFALHQPPVSQTSSDRSSFGKTLRGLRAGLSAGAESLDRRVMALFNADRDELPYRLRQLMQMLKGTPHVPDWKEFLWHLLQWDDPARKVQRRWARDYWTGTSN